MNNNEQNSSTDHIVLGGLLFLVFSLVIALVFVYTRAGTVTTSGEATTTAEVENTAPAVDSINIAYTDGGADISTSTGIDLAVGTTKDVYVWGTVSDANGYQDIDNVSLDFYRSGATGGAACAADNNDCYKVGTCTLQNGSGTDIDYACPISMEFFADGTKTGGEFPAENWIAQITVSDPIEDVTGTDQTEVNTLLALDIPTSIAYGTFGLGDSTSSSTNQDKALSQRGNARADVEVSGVDMTCTVQGSIPVGNQEWALTDVDQGDVASTALTGSAVDTDVAVDYRKGDNTEETKNLYWNILIPSTGVSGVCTGSNTLSIKVAD